MILDARGVIVSWFFFVYTVTHCQLLAVNRLDRLTSGLMIILLSAGRARSVTEEFIAGTVRKEYIQVARVTGRFPS